LVWCADRHISLHKPPRKPLTCCCWITTLFISPGYFSSSPRLSVYRLMALCHLTIYIPHLTGHLHSLTSRLPHFAVPCLTFSSNIPLFRHLRRISCSSLYIIPVAFLMSIPLICVFYIAFSISLWRSWGHHPRSPCVLYYILKRKERHGLLIVTLYHMFPSNWKVFLRY